MAITNKPAPGAPKPNTKAKAYSPYYEAPESAPVNPLTGETWYETTTGDWDSDRDEYVKVGMDPIPNPNAPGMPNQIATVLQGGGPSAISMAPPGTQFTNPEALTASAKPGTVAAQQEIAAAEAEKAKQEAAEQAELDKAQAIKDREEQLALFRREREQDLAAGRARGEEVFGNNALGRVGTETSAEMKDIIARRKAMMDGYTPQEIEAQKAIYLTPAQQALSGQVRAMRGSQAAAGVRGPAASAQEQALRSDFAQKQAQLSQAQALADTEARRQALSTYQESIQSDEANRLAREQSNIAMKNRELLGILSTEMGYGQLGAMDRGYLNQMDVAKEMAAAQAALPAPQPMQSGGGSSLNPFSMFLDPLSDLF